MNAQAIPIFFLSRTLHRERQRDTTEHLPAPFSAVTRSSSEYVPDHEVNARKAASLSGRLSRLARKGALNVGIAEGRARDCSLIYTWGKIPLWPRRPRYVVELDNPYVLGLYGKIGTVRRALLRRLLLRRRCAGIVCISEACRSSTAAVIGDDVAARAQVVYPYVSRGTQAAPGHRLRLDVLFVGTQFWLKGGYELCDAFASVVARSADARLTVVSNVGHEVRTRFSDAAIEFVPARLCRAEIGERMARADLFAMPTLLESFGMAALEALSHGLPILTTDVYALREMVDDGINGILLPDSYGSWRGNEANFGILSVQNLEHHVRGRRFPVLREQLVEALGSLLSDRDRLGAMGGASRELFERSFSPEIRERALRSALQSFLADAKSR